MRKFIPRFFNILTFLIALLIFIPWYSIGDLINSITSKYEAFSFLKGVPELLNDYVGLKVLFIPTILILVSILFLFISTMDRNIKKHDNKSSIPLMNMTLQPIYYLGIAISLSTGIRAFVNKTSFLLKDTDYFGLAKLLTPYSFFSTEYSPLIYSCITLVVCLLFIIFALIFRNNYKRGFAGKFFSLLVMLILLFVTVKFVSDSYTLIDTKSIADLYSFENIKGIEEIKLVDEAHYSLLILGIVFLILYIIFAPIQAKKLNKKFNLTSGNNKKNKKKKKSEKNSSLEEYKEENEKDDDEEYHLQDNELNVINPLFAIPEPENRIETKIEEKTIIKQVVYEQNDLDKVFNYEFGFKYCSMVKGTNETDYYVNKNKFLTISNNGHSISFRLELDKAIRLIIQYPLIGKDKYENHKIWFKIEDIAILSNDVVISIINDAYQTVLNNK